MAAQIGILIGALALCIAASLHYRRRIQEVLRKEGEEQKTGLAALVSSSTREETSIEIALFGSR